MYALNMAKYVHVLKYAKHTLNVIKFTEPCSINEYFYKIKQAVIIY